MGMEAAAGAEKIPVIWGVTALASLLLAAYIIYGAIWRLYFSPIAHIPGPRLAALTLWVEFYYDVILVGRYTFKIMEYHEKYGPIVRISPYEIHVNDYDFFDEIYVPASKGRSNKYGWSVRSWGMNETTLFDAVDHDQHKYRRAVWNPYFSKQSMYKYQGFIQGTVDKLCQRFNEHQADGRPAKLIYAYSNVTADVISEVCFPDSYHLLDSSREFRPEQHDCWRKSSEMQHLFKQFPSLITIFNSFPLWLTKITAPEVYTIIDMNMQLTRQAEDIIARKDHLDTKQSLAKMSMMHYFIHSSALPPHERTASYLSMNSMNVIGAGTMTTAHALKWGTYWILASPSIHSKLMAELEDAVPDSSTMPPLQVLEQLPYLRAIMWESIRLSYGASHRLQRVFPDRLLNYNGLVIPPNTPVGMTSVLLHKDPTVWVLPDKFNPERWLPFDTEGQRLMKYMASFSKGSRQCVGMELAKAEFVCTIASVFRRFGRTMRMDEGTDFARDVEVYHDCFNPMPRKESTGVVVWFDKEGKGEEE